MTAKKDIESRLHGHLETERLESLEAMRKYRAAMYPGKAVKFNHDAAYVIGPADIKRADRTIENLSAKWTGPQAEAVRERMQKPTEVMI